MWHVLENTSVIVCLPYYFDITVGNVFSEPVILCVILRNREDLFICTRLGVFFYLLL